MRRMLQSPQIAAAIDGIAARMREGGRLIYVGAGTSGRLGVLDASECPPTFGTPPETVIGVIASGPEALTGSTRLKAGTAQKMVLNMLSTGAMIRLGKTYGNLMVDVRATNAKLRKRAQQIVAQACEVDEGEAARVLAACDGEVKTAIVALLNGVESGEARRQLAEGGGRGASDDPAVERRSR